jgi:hypothetical protein
VRPSSTQRREDVVVEDNCVKTYTVEGPYGLYRSAEKRSDIPQMVYFLRTCHQTGAKHIAYPPPLDISNMEVDPSRFIDYPFVWLDITDLCKNIAELSESILPLDI